METEVIMKRSFTAPAPHRPWRAGPATPRFLSGLREPKEWASLPASCPKARPFPGGRAQKNRREAERPFRGSFVFSEGNYFFWTYFRQSSMTATRMMMPENTNWRLASMPRVVRE